VELPLLDQRGQVRLGFTDTPRRFGAGAETADLAPLGGFKVKSSGVVTKYPPCWTL
jgi:hypothetical protein